MLRIGRIKISVKNLLYVETIAR